MNWDTIAVGWLARAVAGGFAILAAAAIAVRFCHEPADRVRISTIGLVGALLVPCFALIPGFPRWSIGVLPAETTAASALPIHEPVDISGQAFEDREVLNPLAAKTETVANESQPTTSVKISPAVPSEDSLATTTSISTTTNASAPTPSDARPAVTAPTPSAWPISLIVVVVYGAATSGFIVWSLLGLGQLMLLWRRSRVAPPQFKAILREIAGDACEGVEVLISDEIDAPVAFGTWRPFIVLPAGICADTATETLRYALAHEWSHIERGDVGRWYLVAIAQVVLFYQPMFWWLRRQIRLSQDFLADARSADHAIDPIGYAEYLVSLARRRLRIPSFTLGITDRRSNLTRRVHMLLLNDNPLSRRCRLAWSCGTAFVALGLLIGLSSVRLTAIDPPRAETKADDVKKPALEKEKAGEKTLHYTGKVTDRDTKKPLAGATVVVRRSILGDPTRKEKNPVLEETKHTTDAEGKYSFTIPPEQTSERYLYIELDVEHPEYAAQKNFGYALSMIRKNEKVGGRPFFELVELRPAKPVTGVVKTPDGKPAAGVKLQAYSVTNKKGDGVFEYGSFVDTRTDAEGKFRLPLVTPGWAVVWVLPEEYVPTTHVIHDKRGDLGTFTLATGFRIKGKLLDTKGKPLAGAIVNAESQDRNEEITVPVADNINRSAITNDQGEFEMRPLPTGNYVVKPGQYQRDASLDRNQSKRAEVPDVFIGVKLKLNAENASAPIEVRAVPHVTIEAQHYDSKGKPTRGHAPHIFGRIDGTFWFGEAKIDANGKVTAFIPHGLEEVQLNLMTNEHGSLRWRRGKDGTLNNSRQLRLGTMNDDVKDIEIVKYTSPILIVKVSTKGWDKPPFPTAVTALYGNGKGQLQGRFILAGGRESDVTFEKQEDGRFRSEQLFPDEEVVVTGHAEGYTSKSEKVTLAEGTTKEIEIVLEKASPPQPEKKKESDDKKGADGKKRADDKKEPDGKKGADAKKISDDKKGSDDKKEGVEK